MTNIHFSQRMPEFIIIYGEPAVSFGDNVKSNTMSAHHLDNLEILRDLHMYREPCKDWYEEVEVDPAIEGSVLTTNERMIVLVVLEEGEVVCLAGLGRKRGLVEPMTFLFIDCCLIQTSLLYLSLKIGCDFGHNVYLL